MPGNNLTTFENQIRAFINDLCSVTPAPTNPPESTARAWLRAGSGTQPAEVNEWAGNTIKGSGYPSPEMSWDSKVGQNGKDWWTALHNTLFNFASGTRPSQPGIDQSTWDWLNDNNDPEPTDDVKEWATAHLPNIAP